MNKVKLSVILISASIILLAVSLVFLTVGKVVGQFFFGRSFAERELNDYVSSVLKQELNGSRCQTVMFPVTTPWLLLQRKLILLNVQLGDWMAFSIEGVKLVFLNIVVSNDV
jgi:hypothetical protein